MCTPGELLEGVTVCTLVFSSFHISFGQLRHLGDQEFEARLCRWPLLRYAVFSWGHHAHELAEEPSKDLMMSFPSRSAVLSASIQVIAPRL